MGGPLPIDWVELTHHAENERIPDLDGVSEGLVIGRIKQTRGHSHFYREDTHEYDAYWPDKEVAAHFTVRVDGMRKEAIVHSVFPVDNPGDRYGSDRFEYLG